MHKLTPILFAWWFLVQGFGTQTSSTVCSAVVGPFPNKETCEVIRGEADIRAMVIARASHCWSDKEEPDEKKK
ncbi:MAG: hypothetical protein Q8L47_05415 [bacterium]|nr:hypothetical protein [bacterium]